MGQLFEFRYEINISIRLNDLACLLFKTKPVTDHTKTFDFTEMQRVVCMSMRCYIDRQKSDETPTGSNCEVIVSLHHLKSLLFRSKIYIKS